MDGFGDVVDATKRVANVMLSSGDIGRPSRLSTVVHTLYWSSGDARRLG